MTAAARRPLRKADALAYSRHAARVIAARPELAALSSAEYSLAWLDAELRAVPATGQLDAAQLATTLRQLRQRVVVATTLADLQGSTDLGTVCAVMSRLAEFSIDAALDVHHRELVAIHGEPMGSDSGEPQRLIIVGMGKLGGGELNVSSDIDLVFVYPEQGETRGPRSLPNQEFFDRLGRRVIGALAQLTADGFVFRVDMRLRPYGDSGALSTSFAGLEQYLTAQGRTWERYAWLKARALTGNQERELAALVEPFVFRKYLDFDAYEGLRDVHRQIREQGRRKPYQRNVKLGPGGIREIEFIVQALQLIRGGREPALRARGTLPALAAVSTRNLLPEAMVDDLRASYVFLRNVEHRLQYRDDQQTHDLPRDAAEAEALARACGHASEADFSASLAAQRDTVSRHFDAMFAEESIEPEEELRAIWPGNGAEPGDDSDRQALTAVGFHDPDAILTLLTRIRHSARYLQLPALSRTRFDAIVPLFLRAAAQCESPTVVMSRLLDLLQTVSGRSAYLALLLEHPPVIPRLVHLVDASAWAADYLTRHPILLDELLDSRALLAEPDWDEWRRDLDAQLAASADDAEGQIDALRHFQHAQTFRLLAQDVDGRLTVERLTDHLSALADLVLAAALRECWRFLPNSDAKPATPRFAIIGYGKLGGKELGYASDLDLVFLYDASDEEEAAGAQALYYRLAQRLNTWLTSLTPAGRLYETDLRLRPDGVSGLLVSRLSAFRNYERSHAWTWEHQALTRARFVAGDAAIRAAFDAEREAILRQPRDVDALRAAIVDMRRRMHAGHPNRGSLFDLKHDAGGMVDVEFSVQYLVLAHSGRHVELVRNSGNIALLMAAARLGLVPADVAERAADAYREYRRLQHRIRLQGAAHARVDAAAVHSHREAVLRLWQAIFGAPWQQPAQR